MSAIEDARQISNALITAAITSEDQEECDRLLMTMVERELDFGNMPAVLGATVAMTGNLLKLIAASWGVSAAVAWEAIQRVAREQGLV